MKRIDVLRDFFVGAIKVADDFLVDARVLLVSGSLKHWF
jgi:hypothetical protein